jgi:hypothetical protein
MYFPQSLVTGADSDYNSDSDDEAVYRESENQVKKNLRNQKIKFIILI